MSLIIFYSERSGSIGLSSIAWLDVHVKSPTIRETVSAANPRR